MTGVHFIRENEAAIRLVIAWGMGWCVGAVCGAAAVAVWG